MNVYFADAIEGVIWKCALGGCNDEPVALRSLIRTRRPLPSTTETSIGWTTSYHSPGPILEFKARFR